MAGVNIKTIQVRTGHAQVSTLTNIYAHAIKSAEEAAAEVLDDILIPQFKREQKKSK
jgi:integrase